MQESYFWFWWMWYKSPYSILSRVHPLVLVTSKLAMALQWPAPKSCLNVAALTYKAPSGFSCICLTPWNFHDDSFIAPLRCSCENPESITKRVPILPFHTSLCNWNTWTFRIGVVLLCCFVVQAVFLVFDSRWASDAVTGACMYRVSQKFVLPTKTPLKQKVGHVSHPFKI